jgi:hypothetical protein
MLSQWPWRLIIRLELETKILANASNCFLEASLIEVLLVSKLISVVYFWTSYFNCPSTSLPWASSVDDWELPTAVGHPLNWTDPLTVGQ